MRFPLKSLCVLALSFSSISALAQSGPFELTSKLGRKLYALPDDGTIAKARAKLAQDPKNPTLILALSKAQAGRRQYREAVATDTEGLGYQPSDGSLLLERGHRELGLREFDAAKRDLDQATIVTPNELQAWYHLGMANYFLSDFAAAAEGFAHARSLAQSEAKPDDDLIDTSNWLYVSLRRAGKEKEAADVLTRITPSVKNTEAHLGFYLNLLHFYQGKLTETKVLAAPYAPGDTEGELSFDTTHYGAGNWNLYHGNSAHAKELFEQVVKGDAWNAWGFIGSEVELAGR